MDSNEHNIKKPGNFDLAENQMLNMILDSPYEGMVFIDEDMVIRYVNEAFAAYNKRPKEEIIGHRLEEFNIDDSIYNTFETKAFEPLTYLDNGKKKFIGSRRPVYHNNRFMGVFGRYLSIDPKDVERKYGPDYIDLIARLQTRDVMLHVSETIMELNALKDEFIKLNKAHTGIDNIIGSSPVMQDLKKRILVISDSPSSVLITGESGTGKELFAEAIHIHGNRSSKPFVKVNCAAIPENLLESELFGYVEGAFTGARKGGKMGKFELANKGTLFLDEIGDMPLAMQAKLLRVLQEKEIERLGSEESIPVNVRVITATNKDLYSMVREGNFREDLYYRINVVNLYIPALSERKNDIPEIIDYLIAELNGHLHKNITGISPEAMKIFFNYDWPGNIRELKNILEAAMNFCRGSILDIDLLPKFLYAQNNTQKYKEEPANTSELQSKIDDIEKETLLAVLSQCKGKRQEAANKLNVSKSTFYRMMKKHDLL